MLEDLVSDIVFEYYSIQARSIEFIDHSENVLFKLQSNSGENYSVRFHVFSPHVDFSFASNIHKKEQIANQLNLLSHLNRYKSIFKFHFPRPIKNRAGAFLSCFKGIFFSVLTWCEGRCLDGVICPLTVYYQLGEHLANFHARAILLADTNAHPVYDETYVRYIRDRFIFVSRLIGLSQQSFQRICNGFSETLEVVSSLPKTPAGFCLIHGDMSPGNIIIGQNSLYLIDHSFCGMGFIYQDIGSLFFAVSSSEYQEAFCAGYEAKSFKIDYHIISVFEIFRILLFIVANIKKMTDFTWISSNPYQWLSNLRTT